MFRESTINTIKNNQEPDFNPESLSNMSTEEILATLKIEQPQEGEIDNFKSYMDLQVKVMQSLTNKLGSEQEASELFQNKLSVKFRIEYRHGF